MAANILKNKRFLQSLHRAKGSTHRNLLKKATDGEVKTIQELALNLLHNRIPLTNKAVLKLKPKKRLIRALANKRTTIKHKRKLLVQKGGAILPFLIPAILSFLGSQLGN